MTSHRFFTLPQSRGAVQVRCTCGWHHELTKADRHLDMKVWADHVEQHVPTAVELGHRPDIQFTYQEPT